jgi:hypothetical protein
LVPIILIPIILIPIILIPIILIPIISESIISVPIILVPIISIPIISILIILILYLLCRKWNQNGGLWVIRWRPSVRIHSDFLSIMFIIDWSGSKYVDEIASPLLVEMKKFRL